MLGLTLTVRNENLQIQAVSTLNAVRLDLVGLSALYILRLNPRASSLYLEMVLPIWAYHYIGIWNHEKKLVLILK